MDLGLDGRVALVCASSRGLGRATAERLAREGVSVIVCGRDGHIVDQLAAEIRSTGATCMGVEADLTSESDRNRLVRMGNSQLGTIDIAFLNTAGPPTGTFSDHSLERWKEAYHNILEPVVHLTQLLLPGMAAQGFGRILANTSFSTRAPAEKLVLSSSLRGAVVGLMKSIANEYGPQGVTANCILPGYFLTDRMRSVVEVQSSQDQDASEAIVQQIPIGRWGDPDEFAAMSTFLVSHLAGYITGGVFTIDGGLIRSIY